jgi:hypothetical protein
MGLRGLCVNGVLIGTAYIPNTTAALMSLVPVGELPDYCKDGGVFDILWMNEYAWRLLHV